MKLILLIGCVLALTTPAWGHHSETFNYIQRTVPIVPAAAQRSGYCCMRYDILPNGKTENIRTQYCTDNILRQPSIVAVSTWVYEIQRKDGSPVAEANLTATVGFVLQTVDGTPIEGANGYMSPLPNGKYLKESICSPLIG